MVLGKSFTVNLHQLLILPAVLVIVVLVVIVFVAIIKYRRKHNASLAVSPIIAIPNNSATIAAAKKEKELNEDTFDNPTYSGVKEINSTLPEHNPNMLPSCQDYEVPYNDDHDVK